MELTTKYPRTYHLPFSKGLTNDDRRVDNDWESYIINKPIVIIEKMDGSSSAITKHGVFARSHAIPTENPWDINLTEKGGLYDYLKDQLWDNMCIYLENMYAIHSIEYNRLPVYNFIFAYREMDMFRTWKEVEILSSLTYIPTPHVFFEGKVKSVKELKEMIEHIMTNIGSKYGDTIEGVVVRNTNEFHYNDFSKYVTKYVRKNHVQTDEHWRKNWKKHKLIYEYGME
jgi:hypothetical protein